MFNIYPFSSFCAFLICSFLAILVYYRGKDKPINKTFASVTFLIGIWCLFPYLTFIAKDASQKLFFARLVYVAAIFTPSSFLYFSLTILNAELPQKDKNFIKGSYFISIIFLIFAFNPLLIRAILNKGIYNIIDPGILYLGFFLFFGWACGYSFFRVFMEFRKSAGYKKNLLKYVFISFIIAYIGGILHFIAAYLQKEPIPHDIFIITFAAIMSYAIVKYNLMSIDVVLKELLARTLSFLILTVAAYLSVVLVLKWLNLLITPTIIILSLILMGIFFSLHRKFSSVISRTFRPRQDFEAMFRQYTEAELIESHDIKELADVIVRTVNASLRPQVCSLMLLDRKSKLYNVVASSGEDEEIKSIAFKEMNHLISALKNSHKLRLIIKDELNKVLPENEADLVKRDLEILKAQICLPLILKGELLGILNIGPKFSGELYTPEEMGFIFAFTAQSAMMIRFLEEIGHFQKKLIYAEKISGIDEMLGSTNHELNNLISVIKSMTQILNQKQGLSPEDRAKAMQQILTYTERASSVTGWVNDYRRKLDYTELIEIDINKAIEEAIPVIKEQLLVSLDKVQIIKNIPKDLPKLRGKATLPGLFFHLLANSCYSMEEKGGQLKISARKLDSNYIELEIIDTGGDIAKPMQKGPDFGGAWFAERSQLGGINLFLARLITNNNQGIFLNPQSNQGKGAIFIVQLPIKQKAQAKR